MVTSITGIEATLRGDVLTVQPAPGRNESEGDSFLVGVTDATAAKTLLASLPLLDRLLAKKVVALRERQLEELVDFLTERLVEPSAIELEMAQRLASRHAGLFQEFGYFTAEQLAEANNSSARHRGTLVDNWRKRGQVFAVPHPDRAARDRDVYPAFQFDAHHRPIKAVQGVLRAFDGRKAPWKLALWFTSNNGWLPDSARPVDLLEANAQAVVEAANLDAQRSAA